MKHIKRLNELLQLNDIKIGLVVKSRLDMIATHLNKDGSYTIEVQNIIIPKNSILTIKKEYNSGFEVEYNEELYNVSRDVFMIRCDIFKYSDKLNDLNKKTCIFNN